MIAGIVAMVANVLGNYALIEPRFGLPGYGVAGAAWASVAASFLGFAVIAGAFLSGYGHDLPPGKLGFRRAEFTRVLRFGLPNGVNWFLEFSAFILFINAVVGHLGTSVLAAFNVVMQINALSFMPAFGAASAGAILVGEAIGADQKAKVPSLVKLTLLTTSVWMASIGLLYVAAPGVWIGLFVPEGASAGYLLATGTTMLSLSALWQLFDAMGLTLSEALRAAGDTTWCMVARILLAWFVFTPLSWSAVFVFGGGVNTVMVSLIAYIALLAAAFALRFKSGRWQRIQLLGEPAAI
jgi:MATE family multidrug resistance protein